MVSYCNTAVKPNSPWNQYTATWDLMGLAASLGAPRQTAAELSPCAAGYATFDLCTDLPFPWKPHVLVKLQATNGLVYLRHTWADAIEISGAVLRVTLTKCSRESTAVLPGGTGKATTLLTFTTQAFSTAWTRLLQQGRVLRSVMRKDRL